MLLADLRLTSLPRSRKELFSVVAIAPHYEVDRQVIKKVKCRQPLFFAKLLERRTPNVKMQTS